MQQGSPRRRRLLLNECEFDCDSDSDCLPGLLCADDHKIELLALGLDPRKADCGNAGDSNDEVCFKEELIESFAGLGDCQFGCDVDDDCAAGLLCADDHKHELETNGLDNRKAACFPDVGPSNEEVCFKEGLLEREVCRAASCRVGSRPFAQKPFINSAASLAECFAFCETAQYLIFTDTGPPVPATPPVFDNVYVGILDFTGLNGNTICVCIDGPCSDIIDTSERGFPTFFLTAKGVKCDDLDIISL